MRVCALVLLALGSLVGLAGLLSGAEDARTDQELRKLEQEWAEAEQKRDVVKVGQILATDYHLTIATGELRDKEAVLRELKSGELSIEASMFADKRVRVYGDTAVVTARLIIKKGKYKGTDISGESRYTNVYVKKDGRWQCVCGQYTPIAKK